MSLSNSPCCNVILKYSLWSVLSTTKKGLIVKQFKSIVFDGVLLWIAPYQHSVLNIWSSWFRGLCIRPFIHYIFRNIFRIYMYVWLFEFHYQFKAICITHLLILWWWITLDFVSCLIRCTFFKMVCICIYGCCLLLILFVAYSLNKIFRIFFLL